MTTMDSRLMMVAADLRRRAMRDTQTVSTWVMNPETYMMAVAETSPSNADNELRLLGIPVEINNAPGAPDLVAKTEVGELVGEPLGELPE